MAANDMLKNIKRSLEDLLGTKYCEAAVAARCALSGEEPESLLSLAREKVDFYPESFAKRQEALMGRMGSPLIPAFENGLEGAPTDSFKKAQLSAASPLSGLGCFRVGEDGRLYFAAKSEHYHIPLGHAFPGYSLLETAKKLGVPNASHNNNRGYITRLCERSIVAAAAGLSPTDAESIDRLLASREKGDLNRVINLETGSLAVEAALKMMLGRFYTLTGSDAELSGRIPVFLVMGDNAGGITAGYHGTTVFAQTLRGLWPGFAEKAKNGELYRVVPVPINDPAAFRRIVEEWNRPPFKTAGFCHEIVMMNYGGILLSEEFLQSAYAACREYDTPVLCDEIQSCAWYEGMFLFRRYGLRPDFVSMGKGFPGGNYPASRVLACAEYDNMIQFGALVTNGQEELASLSYLITMEYIAANGKAIGEYGQYYHSLMRRVAEEHSALCSGCEGDRHMTALCFRRVEDALDFCERMQKKYGVDISAQAYKPNCPPAALTKLPLIVTPSMMDTLADAMRDCLRAVESEGK